MTGRLGICADTVRGNGKPTRNSYVSVCERAVVITDSDPMVHDWAEDYLGRSWTVSQAAPSRRPFYSVAGRVDVDTWREISDSTPASAERITTLTGYPGSRWRTGEVTLACTTNPPLAYVHDRSRAAIEVTGVRPAIVAHAVTILVRELLARELEHDSWVVVHAAGTVCGTSGTLFLGDKGAGKTTAALTLVSHSGHALIGNDEVLVRVEGDRLRALPWPASPGVGLRLLKALGWWERARDSLMADPDSIHPLLPVQVIQHMARGNYYPLFDESGRELKYDVLPSAMASWFGVEFAREAVISRLCFPAIRQGVSVDVDDGGSAPRPLRAEDFKLQVGRYPNFLDLPDISPVLTARARATAEALGKIPQHNIILGHDQDANASLLENVFGRC